jgi:hypothetical protein
LAALADSAAGWLEDPATSERLPPDLFERWTADGSRLIDDCRRLDALGPGPSIVHGDLHPWNMTRANGIVRIFDWTDAAVSHPFVDLAEYVFRAKDQTARGQILDAYLAQWAGVLLPDELADAARLALVVGALYQVQTYRMLTGTLMDPGQMGGAEAEWLRRALSRRELGLESPS